MDTGTFEETGKGYWWNLKSGCICPAGSKFGSLVNERCTDIKLRDENNCMDIPYNSEEYLYMPIVNNKKFCGYRDGNYRLEDIVRPDKNNKCGTNNKKMNKLCGKVTGKPSENYCIPSNSRCPITDLEWQNN